MGGMIQLNKARLDELTRGCSDAGSKVKSISMSLPGMEGNAMALQAYRSAAERFYRDVQQYASVLSDDAAVLSKAVAELEKADQTASKGLMSMVQQH